MLQSNMFTLTALYVIHFNITNIISTEKSYTLTLFQKISTATCPAHHIHLHPRNRKKSSADDTFDAPIIFGVIT